MRSPRQGEGRLSMASDALGRGAPGIARSFRHHRPRGAFCGRGWCQQCPVATAEGTRLGCEIPPGEGRPRRPDILRPLGAWAERLPPWFYEGRFLRPRWLRQPALRVLRSLGSAPRLPQSPPAGATRGWSEDRCGTLVVGGGPAGLSAAATLAEEGEDVLVAEAELPGGTARFVPELRSVADDARQRLIAAGGRLASGATCIGADAETWSAMLVDGGGIRVVRWDRIVVATGAYDRPLLYRGNDLPGTVGVRGLEAMSPSLRGRSAGVVAGPDEARRAVRAAEEAGVRVAWVEMEDPLVEAGGRGRVRWARFERGAPRPCDLLVLGFSQPTYELQAQLGIPLKVGGTPPVVTAGDGGALPVLVVGEAAGWGDPAAGATAAVAAARSFRTSRPEAVDPRPDPAVSHPDAYVCWCEDVRVRDVEQAVAEGFGHVELVKRRTGATTGPCQGKLCLGPCLEVLGGGTRTPTARPPVRPVALADLAGGADD